MVNVKHENMLNNYSEILGENIGEYFDVKVVHENEHKKIFYGQKGSPQEQAPRFNYLLILVDFAYKKYNSCYPKALLKECKYLVKDKEKKIFMTENKSLFWKWKWRW